MNEENIKLLNRKYTLFPYTEQQYAEADVLERGEGVYVYDVNGKQYMDLSSEFINVNIGWGNEKIVEAVNEQMKKLHYVKPECVTDVRGKLCEKIICDIAPPDMQKVFLTLGGSDANDFAVRIAKAVTGKRKILSQYHSYHGATIGAANLCGDHERIYEKLENRDFIHFMGYNSKGLKEYFDDDDKYCDFLLELLEETILLEAPNSIAAIFFETISLGNIVIPSKRYYQGVRSLCDKYNILLIFDEVLVGFGRTGKWFACEHYQVWPDIMTFAKGVTSSYMPLGGVIINKKIAEKMEYVYFSATLTGSYHPVSCAAAYAAISFMQENKLIDNAQKVGAYLKKCLEEQILPHPYVAEVRGIGLLHSIIFKGKMDTRSAAINFSNMLRENGYIVYVDRTGIVIAPPLIITEEQIDLAVKGIKDLLDGLKENNYMDRLQYYPNESAGAEKFYSLRYMKQLEESLCQYNNILLMGSTNAHILKIISANLRNQGRHFKLYLSNVLFNQMDSDDRDYCIMFDGDRFDLEKQKNDVEKLKYQENFDCILMPYTRVDNRWDNIYEIAKEFKCPVFRISRHGDVIKMC